MQAVTWANIDFMRWFALQMALGLSSLLVCWNVALSAPSDAAIRKALIEQSIAAYPGNCPCPYNLDRAGRRCGARSAYSKPGGRAPLCFAEDVSEEMIERYRDRASDVEPAA